MAVGQPALATADETAHVDYVLAVWDGRLPDFEDGLQFRPGPPAQVPPVQWVSQHPPLFYLTLAPVLGPLADHVGWVGLTLAGRGVTVLMGVLLMLAVLRAAHVIFQGDRRRILATGIVVVPMSAPLFVSSAVYNDVLAAVFTALALGTLAKVLLEGSTWPRLAQLAVLASLGMLTRGMFAATVAVIVLGVAVAALAFDTRPLRQRLLRAAAAVAAIVASVLVTSGWFYARNVRLTGSWSGGHTDWAVEHLGRASRSITAALANEHLRNGYTRIFFGSGAGWALIANAVVMAMVFALGVRWLLSLRRGTPGNRDARRLAVIGILSLQTVATVVVQVTYVSSGGGANFRYSLPALVPVALLIAASLTSTSWFRSAPVLLYAAVGTVLLAFGIGSRGRFDSGHLMNGPPSWVFVACVAGACVAIVAGALLALRVPSGTTGVRSDLDEGLHAQG